VREVGRREEGNGELAEMELNHYKAVTEKANLNSMLCK
jgi:hypothetical protein